MRRRTRTAGIAVATVGIAGALSLGAGPASAREATLARAVPSAHTAGAMNAAGAAFVDRLSHNVRVASTVPGNGDVNPYGVALVPRTRGRLVAGDILVSNFNNRPTAAAPGGQQGTGTTLVQISPDGRRTLFSQVPRAMVPGGVGLTTALVVLRSGWVIVGSLPTTDGTAATARAGSLIVLDSTGKVRETIVGHGIDGPWDATALDRGGSAEVFVSNVLTGIVNGQPRSTHRGDVVRLSLDVSGSLPRVRSSVVIGDDLAVHTDPAALVVGPTGLALDRQGKLFVADTARSRIAVVPNAVGRRTTVDAGALSATVSAASALNGPLGLALAPDGDLLTVNAGDNNLVELSRTGTVEAVRDLDPADPPGGALFGLAVTSDPAAVYYVNDDTNTLDVLR